MTRTCLIISPHFPPSTLAGVHRARHLVKHLPAFGWRTKVICVDPRFHIERLDPGLGSLVPTDAPVIRVGALPVTLTRPVGIAGDIGLRGFFHIRSAIDREIRADRPDVVMITGSPYFPMLLAGWIKRRWGVPILLDFQDPWVTSASAEAKAGSKAWLAHKLAMIFEPKVVRHAAFITSVSDRQNDELADRHLFVDRSRMAGIPIGGDPMDFEAMEFEPVTAKSRDRRACRIAYTGTVWPAAIPVLRMVLLGLQKASVALGTACDLEAVFMGTTANPNATDEFRVQPLALESLVSEKIKEIPERRPYLEAVRLMADANINLIIGSLEPHYTASKIFPILMANRPFLSVLHRQSSAHAILSSTGGGVALSFETLEELEELPPKIAEAIVTLATKPDSLGKVNPAAYADYTAHAVAGRFAGVFDRLRNERLKRLVSTPAA